MSNLRFLREVNISSAVDTVNVVDVFSSDYDIYQITTQDLMTTAYSRLNFHLIDTAGTIMNEPSTYYYSVSNTASGSTSSLSGSSEKFVNAFGYGLSSSGNNSQGATVHVFDPFQNSYTYMINEAGSNGSNLYQNSGGAMHLLVAQHSGFAIAPQLISGSNPQINQGKIRVYGYRRD